MFQGQVLKDLRHGGKLEGHNQVFISEKEFEVWWLALRDSWKATGIGSKRWSPDSRAFQRWQRKDDTYNYFTRPRSTMRSQPSHPGITQRWSLQSWMTTGSSHTHSCAKLQMVWHDGGQWICSCFLFPLSLGHPCSAFLNFRKTWPFILLSSYFNAFLTLS